jgi:hypothetical protein
MVPSTWHVILIARGTGNTVCMVECGDATRGIQEREQRRIMDESWTNITDIDILPKMDEYRLQVQPVPGAGTRYNKRWRNTHHSHRQKFLARRPCLVNTPYLHTVDYNIKSFSNFTICTDSSEKAGGASRLWYLVLLVADGGGHKLFFYQRHASYVCITTGLHRPIWPHQVLTVYCCRGPSKYPRP